MFNKKIIITCLSLLPFLASASNAPSMGGETLADKIGMGSDELKSQFLGYLNESYSLVKDPEILDYVRSIGKRISSNSNVGKKISFYVINDSSINAFAGPEGVIALNTGVLSNASSEDEVAAVIAHEMSHVVQEHLVRKSDLGGTTVYDALALGTAVIAGMIEPNAGIAAYSAFAGKKASDALSVSRDFEYEADSVGIRMLQEAGYNPYAMAYFFDKLHRANANSSEVPEFLMTHPVTQHRTSKALDRAQLYSNYSKVITPQINHALIKIRVASLNNQELDASELSRTEKCYLSSLQSTELDNPLVIGCSRISVQENPGNLLLGIEQVRKTKLVDIEKQIDHLKFYQETNPSSLSAMIRLIEVMQRNGKGEGAAKYLEDRLNQIEYKAIPYQKLSELYASLEKLDKAYFYKALSQRERGNEEMFLSLIKQAKKISTDQNLIAQINLSLEQVSRT